MTRALPQAGNTDITDPHADEQWDFFAPVQPVTEAPQAPIEPLPRLVSAAQAAEAQGVSTRPLRRWEKAGRLAPRRVGRSLFYLVDDIDRAIAAEITARALGTKTSLLPASSHAASAEQDQIQNPSNRLYSGDDSE